MLNLTDQINAFAQARPLRRVAVPELSLLRPRAQFFHLGDADADRGGELGDLSASK
jgi:hypothetical protein